MRVILNKSEMAQAKQAAALRWQLARAANVSDKLIGKNHDPADVDLVGIKAEIAVAKLFRAVFNPNTLGIDSGVDLYVTGLSAEFGVQVKSTHHKDAQWMLINPDPDDEWDVAVFVRPCEMDEVMDVHGIVSKNRCMDLLEEIDLGHGVSTGVRAENLVCPSVLWKNLHA